MYIDRMIELIEKICGSKKLSRTEKSEALGEVVYCILCEGEAEGIEHGDSNANFHPLKLIEEEKDKTIVVRKQMLESATNLNKILCKTRIKWDASGIGEKEIKSIQHELHRRGIAVPA